MRDLLRRSREVEAVTGVVWVADDHADTCDTLPVMCGEDFAGCCAVGVPPNKFEKNDATGSGCTVVRVGWVDCAGTDAFEERVAVCHGLAADEAGPDG